ncbi:MAG: hypothetical protein ACRD26_24115 [Vicinamibacterales bacterium]
MSTCQGLTELIGQLGNALEDRPSLTLHVDGGELTMCRVFLPRPDGRYERQDRCLGYHE